MTRSRGRLIRSRTRSNLAMQDEKISNQIKELTLLLLSLTSWSEKIGRKEIRRAWKGYDFDVLDQLYGEGLISGSRQAKSVYLTDAGIAKAEMLAKKLYKKVWQFQWATKNLPPLTEGS